MLYPHLQLAPGEILHYVHSDGFTERLLGVSLTVDAAYSYRAVLRHHLPYPARSAQHVHEYNGQLPPAAADAVAALLAQPGLAALPGKFSGFDDCGSCFFLFRAAGQEYRLEVEEPYGRRGAPPASAAERALLAARQVLDAWMAELYDDALATARRP